MTIIKFLYNCIMLLIMIMSIIHSLGTDDFIGNGSGKLCVCSTICYNSFTHF